MIPRLLLFKYETGIFSMNLMHRAIFDMYTISTLVLVDTIQGFHSSGPSIWLAFLLSPFAVWSDERRLDGRQVGADDFGGGELSAKSLTNRLDQYSR